jgi:phage terminase small subunit
MKLTPKQRAWLKFFLDYNNKETFFNKTAAARAARYKCKSPECFESIGYENYRKLEVYIKRWIDENALSDVKLKKLLIEGLEAIETRFFAHKGEVVTEKTVIPWDIRRKFLELAFRLKDFDGILERIQAIEERLNQEEKGK